MRPFTLTAIKTGISRIRIKGGARPDALYDLINAQINPAKEIIPRPGSGIFAAIESSEFTTYGLVFYHGKYHVFSDSYFAITTTAEVILHILPYPFSGEIGFVPPVMTEIILAEPFLGYLFVVAKYENGEVFYFWLIEGDDGGEVWQPNTVYALNHAVVPSTPNGYSYQATRLNPAAKPWAPGVERAVGDVVEPTKPNGYEYVCIDTLGARPRSGLTEPKWIAETDSIVYEDADNADTTAPIPPTSPVVPGDVDDRYNRGRYRGVNIGVDTR